MNFLSPTIILSVCCQTLPIWSAFPCIERSFAHNSIITFWSNCFPYLRQRFDQMMTKCFSIHLARWRGLKLCFFPIYSGNVFLRTKWGIFLMYKGENTAKICLIIHMNVPSYIIVHECLMTFKSFVQWFTFALPFAKLTLVRKKHLPRFHCFPLLIFKGCHTVKIRRSRQT